MQLYTAAQSRELDRLAIEEYGIPGYELMQRAGRAVFTCLGEHWPEARHLAVVCGTGNNGGDGFVVARLAHRAGLRVNVLLLGEAARLRGDAALAYRDMRAAGIEAMAFAGELPGEADLIIDALFGTGLDRPPQGMWRRAIEAMNAHPAEVLAVDIPSGLHADTGQALELAVRARRCVTFIGLKRGLFTGQGPDYCGTLSFADLGVPAYLHEAVASDCRLLRPPVSRLLPKRRHNSHKGDYGHVLVVGGNQGMAGAARLAAEAAARMGAGLISVITRPGQAGIINAGRPELMVHETADEQDMAALLKRATLVAIGPGLGQDAWAQAVWRAVMQWPGPKVVDADGLNWLARQPTHSDNWVLTPHPGEAARLLACDTRQVQADRFAAAREIQRRFGGVCVLKGCGSIVAHAAGSVVCAAGNPGMAAAGMGDVLTGVVAGLWAQAPRLALEQVAATAVLLHAQAGDRAARDGERGLLAADLLPWLRRLVDDV